MQHLAAEGYTVIDLMTAVAMLDAGEVPPRTCSASRSTTGSWTSATQALPVLAELGFRATVFVTTGVTDGRLRFPWYARQQPPVLGWDEVVALDREGTLRFEAHTVSHPNLLSLDDAAARAEIMDGRHELEQHLGRRGLRLRLPGRPVRRARATPRRRGGLHRRRHLRAGGQPPVLGPHRHFAGARSTAAIACWTSGPRSAAVMTRRCRCAASTGGCATAPGRGRRDG